MSVINLPWGAWYEDAPHPLRLPQHWTVDVHSPADAPECDPRDIEESLNTPIEAAPPHVLARNCRSACIVVDDLARPTRASDVLPPLLRQLEQSGLPPDAVRIVVATGSHGQLDREEMAWKVGIDVATRYR
ncbi:MAG: lactate racemase domain-containing protein, partial [Haliea sp.]